MPRTKINFLKPCKIMTQSFRLWDRERFSNQALFSMTVRLRQAVPCNVQECNGSSFFRQLLIFREFQIALPVSFLEITCAIPLPWRKLSKPTVSTGRSRGLRVSLREIP